MIGKSVTAGYEYDKWAKQAKAQLKKLAPVTTGVKIRSITVSPSVTSNRSDSVSEADNGIETVNAPKLKSAVFENVRRIVLASTITADNSTGGETVM